MEIFNPKIIEKVRIAGTIFLLSAEMNCEFLVEMFDIFDCVFILFSVIIISYNIARVKFYKYPKNLYLISFLGMMMMMMMAKKTSPN